MTQCTVVYQGTPDLAPYTRLGFMASLWRLVIKGVWFSVGLKVFLARERALLMVGETSVNKRVEARKYLHPILYIETSGRPV